MVQHPSKQIMSQLIKRQRNLHSIQAAVVNSKGEIFSIGETTVADDHDPTAHAEVNAIRKACQQLGTSELPKEYWLYSIFEPCPLCSSAAVWAGVEVLSSLITQISEERNKTGLLFRVGKYWKQVHTYMRLN